MLHCMRALRQRLFPEPGGWSRPPIWGSLALLCLRKPFAHEPLKSSANFSISGELHVSLSSKMALYAGLQQPDAKAETYHVDERLLAIIAIYHYHDEGLRKFAPFIR